MKRYGHYINGSYVHNKHYIERVFSDPLNGKGPIGISTLSLKDPSSEELYEAAVIGAQESWKQIQEGFFPLNERISFLERVLIEFEKHQENLAQLVMRETHKPIKLARVEVSRAMNTLKVSIKTAPKFLETQKIDHDAEFSSNHKIEIQRVPRGPVLAISPFNFPINLVAHKIFPAIAAGCPVILKPSDKTPLTNLYIIDLCHHARVPAGLLQLIHCENEMVAKFAADPRIAFVSFTGSAKVGWSLARQTSSPIALELGGNSPVYVDESANLNLAAKKIVEGAFMHAGQSCISVQNVYVHEKVGSEFSKILTREVEQFPYGDPENDSVLCGPPVNSEATTRINASLEKLLKMGAKILAQSKSFIGDKNSISEFVSPCLLGNVNEHSFFCQEEIFAPIMSLSVLDSYDSFIKIARSRDHRLQCGIFTNNIEQHSKAKELDYGGVLINESSTFRIDALPYGGQAMAGIGREGPLYAMEDFTTYKCFIVAEPKN